MLKLNSRWIRERMRERRESIGVDLGFILIYPCVSCVRWCVFEEMKRELNFYQAASEILKGGNEMLKGENELDGGEI